MTTLHKLTLILAIALCDCGSLMAGGAGTRLILTSEVLQKEILLWDATCPAMRHERQAQECATDKARLVKRLLDFAKYCDEVAASFKGGVGSAEELQQMALVQAAWKLQATAARFHAKHLGEVPSVIGQHHVVVTKSSDIAEAKKIVKEQARLAAADIKFAMVGLLSEDMMQWMGVAK
jgi:hypothetical protein